MVKNYVYLFIFSLVNYFSPSYSMHILKNLKKSAANSTKRPLPTFITRSLFSLLHDSSKNKQIEKLEKESVEFLTAFPDSSDHHMFGLPMHLPMNDYQTFFAKLHQHTQLPLYIKFETLEDAWQIFKAFQHKSSLKSRHTTHLLRFSHKPKNLFVTQKNDDIEPRKYSLAQVKKISWFGYNSK